MNEAILKKSNKLKDYYNILEVDFGLDILAIKKAYRRLALRYHPDKNNSYDANQIFIEITEAYVVLSNPITKEEYDRLYQAFFRTKSTAIFSPSDHKKTSESRQREWAEFGKEKAKEFSSIPFEVFARQLLKELNVGASYIPNAIAILFVVGGALGMLTILPKSFEDSSGGGLFLTFIIVCLFYLGYRLFLVAEADYKEERKQKILYDK